MRTGWRREITRGVNPRHGDLSTHISHSVSEPDAHRTATPAIKSNKFYSDLDGECRGNVQSDARWAARSCDRVKPGCSSLAEDIHTCSYLPCGTIHRQVGHVASVCSSWSPVLEFLGYNRRRDKSWRHMLCKVKRWTETPNCRVNWSKKKMSSFARNITSGDRSC